MTCHSEVLVYSAQDIDPDLATWAFSGTSMDPEARLAEIERQARADEQAGCMAREYPFADGVVVDDPLTNRYTIAYPERPDEATLSKLHARGFHYTHERLWQRQRTPNAAAAVEELTGVKI